MIIGVKVASSFRAMKKSVMEVYRELMERAQYCKEQEQEAIKAKEDEAREVYGSLRAELYYWAGQLELTSEVNPPKVREKTA